MAHVCHFSVPHRCQLSLWWLFCSCCLLQGYLPGAVHGIEAAKSVRFGSLAADGAMLQHTARGQLQVLLRVCVKKPATHNTTASLQANLAGLLVNAKTPGGDELLNLTVDTVQCSMVTSSRERQLSVSVRSVQLDNQLLETRQPVVLSPATMGEVRDCGHSLLGLSIIAICSRLLSCVL